MLQTSDPDMVTETSIVGEFVLRLMDCWMKWWEESEEEKWAEIGRGQNATANQLKPQVPLSPKRMVTSSI